MRQRVVKALRQLDAQSVENMVRNGTPDVDYADGKLELKWARRWPVRPETPLRVKHVSQGQRVWWIRRARAGGQSWVLLQVGMDWLLFEGPVAAALINTPEATHAALTTHARKRWERGLVESELVEFLRARPLLVSASAPVAALAERRARPTLSVVT